jgi:hypothetical protein
VIPDTLEWPSEIELGWSWVVILDALRMAEMAGLTMSRLGKSSGMLLVFVEYRLVVNRVVEVVLADLDLWALVLRVVLKSAYVETCLMFLLNVNAWQKKEEEENFA